MKTKMLWYSLGTPVLSSILINFLIPNIPKTDLWSSQIVESDDTLGITNIIVGIFLRFSNKKIREIDFKNHLLYVLLTSCFIFRAVWAKAYLDDFENRLVTLSMVGCH